MPLYFKSRRRKKNLREEMLAQNIDENNKASKESSDTLSSTPVSLKGSFLRNKLDNPLFKRKRKIPEAPEETEYESDTEHEDDSDDSNSIISIHRSDEESKEKTKSRTLRFGSSFFTRRGKAKKRIGLHLSSSSSSSSSSSVVDSSEEVEVETLTKFEDENVNNTNSNNQSYLLYTHKGQPVRVQFCYDYLLITPVYSKLSLSRRGRVQECKTIYYEDLALWTNNDECLRLVHIKNKETALQERTEIKLFVSKKKRQVTLKEINQDLKDKISVLISNKKNISLVKAQELLETNNTKKDIKKVVQKIDRSAEKAIVRNYSNQNFELLNV